MAKRGVDAASSDVSAVKHPKHTIDTTRSTFEDLCPDILLEIFNYLRPVELLVAFFNAAPIVETLLEPYTHTLDVRLTNKSCFQRLLQSLLPSFSHNLRVLRLSNAHTFSQISDLMYQFDWSQIKQLESLTLDSIKPDELSRYFLTVHPLLEKLWRLSLTFDEDDRASEQLLLNHLFLSPSAPVRNCFIHGITMDLSQASKQKSNDNLRELTMTLSSISDLLILCRAVPRLEILNCTIAGKTSIDHFDSIPSLAALTTLSLTINEQIEFRTLQTILSPHAKITHLTLKAILLDKSSSKEIGGFELEKFFRTFAQLTDLHFYLRQVPHNPYERLENKVDCVYLYSFTSHFWLDRSIEVSTHFVDRLSQRYIYTLPFAFDTFDIDGDIQLFFRQQSPRPYTNVRRLFLALESTLHEWVYSNTFRKAFPNLTLVTYAGKPSQNTINTLNKHQWIQEQARPDTVTTSLTHVYHLNGPKSTHWHCRRLDIGNEVLRNNSKRVRQLTIYEMTKDQLISLSYFFPRIYVLTLHVDTFEWLSLLDDGLHRLLSSMVSLLSLTIYYPKSALAGSMRVHDSFASTLLAMKTHFFIRCTDGILNIWF